MAERINDGETLTINGVEYMAVEEAVLAINGLMRLLEKSPGNWADLLVVPLYETKSGKEKIISFPEIKAALKKKGR